jgi:3-dehydroquinate dehydratase
LIIWLPFNLYCDIVDLRYDFINFNFEKLIYAEAIVTSIVHKILSAILALRKESSLFI